MNFNLLENVFTSVSHKTNWDRKTRTYFIYINPTPKELHSSEDSKDNRGLIDVNGDLYMEALWEPHDYDKLSSLLHGDLLGILHDEGKFQDMPWPTTVLFLEEGIYVQRERNTFNFHLAESYRQEFNNDEMKTILKITDLCKKKNPHLKFTYIKAMKRKLGEHNEI